MELKLPRLLAAAKEFNVGQETLFHFLKSRGFKEELLKPTMKLSEDMYRAAWMEYFPDRPFPSNKLKFKSDVDLTEKPKKVNNFSDIHKIVPTDQSQPIHRVPPRPAPGPVYRGRPATGSENSMAIGRLKFFDYLRNKFGIIENVITEQGSNGQAVKIYEDGIETTHKLNDGAWLFFTLRTGNHNNARVARNVVLLVEAEESVLRNFLPKLDTPSIFKIASHLKAFRNHELSSGLKNEIAGLLGRNLSKEYWAFVMEWSDSHSLEYYRTAIGTFDLANQISYLQAWFDLKVFELLLAKYENPGKESVLALLNLVKNNPHHFIELHPSLLIAISKHDWTFGEIVGLSERFPHEIIQSRLVQSYSFLDKNAFTNLHILIKNVPLSESHKLVLQENFAFTARRLDAKSILSIFVDYRDLGLIENEATLLALLSDKKLEIDQLERLIKILSNECDIERLNSILKNNSMLVTTYYINDLLTQCRDKPKVARVVFDRLVLSSETRSSVSDELLFQIIEREDLPNDLRKSILKTFISRLVKDFLRLIKVASNMQEYGLIGVILKKITFSSDVNMLNFIKTIQACNLPSAVTDQNKPLQAFMVFLGSTSPSVNPDLQHFLRSQANASELVAIKYLVYLHHRLFISKPQLLSLASSIDWTMVSAKLVSEFISESEYPNTVLLDKLHNVFLLHFESLQRLGIGQANLKYFKLKGMLTSCNGRKKYSANYSALESRWYAESDPSIVVQEGIEGYCEGRLWKKEKMWYKNSIRQMEGDYDFYWCRNSYCAARNDLVDLNKPFHQWTIVDLAEVCGIKIEKMALAHLSGWANRINQIVDRLNCRNCGHMLRPTAAMPRRLGHYAVPTFHCINDSCQERFKVVRFTHCLNGKCESHLKSEPLDSRDCESCDPSDPNHSGMRCKFCQHPCPQCSGGRQNVFVQTRGS